MGGGRFDPGDWQNYASSRNLHSASTKAQHIYTQSAIFEDFDPAKIKNGVRESRDSNDNPNSTPIIVGLDVTGSMSHVLEVMAKQGLKTLMEEVYKRKPVNDPHLLVAAVGDAFCDSAPLQVSQFEADIRIAEQLEKLYLEQGGGGNGSEGYSLLHYFAATHTVTDAWEKRQKKGYLFTIGNDGPTPEITSQQFQDVFGDKAEGMTGAQVLTMVSRQWEVFHLNLHDGYGGSDNYVGRAWKTVLGERALTLTDHTKMAEVIVSTIQVLEGANAKSVADSWNGDTSIVVRNALGGLTQGNKSKTKGLTTL